ncbi:MAG: endonuclease/exonuclease/phosphatase family protein [Sulfuricurvum sp.]|nr:endonuclease/exonuclease/phosphatase family protein [Sulfuricurvum sp.]
MRILWLLALIMSLLGGVEVKIATYNVENLFDMNNDGTEYEEYIPNGDWGWNEAMYRTKLRNTASVIRGIGADIIGLQEIESETALKDLKAELNRQGLYYRYYVFARGKNSSVNTALLSRYPIESGLRHPVSHSRKYRDILEAKINIDGKFLRVFVNHWKSKSGPESERILSAKRLQYRLNELAPNEPFILIGDFNSHFEEYKTFIKSRKLNDTDGVTGINTVLKTIDEGGNPVTYLALKKNDGHLYNLWYELDSQKRWSHQYKGQGEGLDNIIISPALADGIGIEYVQGSFNRYDPDYLFYKGKIYRWQQSRKYPKHHLGEGYSDHLPIYADFRL